MHLIRVHSCSLHIVHFSQMTCPHCRTLSCYVCRKEVRGYDHFNVCVPRGLLNIPLILLALAKCSWRSCDCNYEWQQDLPAVGTS